MRSILTTYRVPAKNLEVAAFLLMALICFGNLNGVSLLFFRRAQVLSVVILAATLVILGPRGLSSRSAMGKAGAWFLACLGLLVVIGAMVKPETGFVLRYTATWLLVSASAVATVLIIRRFGVRMLLGMVTVFACLGAWTVFLTPFLGSLYAKKAMSDHSFESGRYLGFFTNPNETGFAALWAITCCFSCLSLPRQKYQKTLVAALAITSVGLLLSFCRSAILTSMGLFGFYALVMSRGTRRSGSMILGGSILCVVAYWFFSGGYEHFDWKFQQLRRIQSVEKIITGQQTESTDLGGRLDGAKGAIHYWMQSPIIGQGLGSFHRMPERYFGGLGCHNTHLAILGEGGLITALVYVGFLGVWVRTGWRCRHPSIRALSVGLFLAFFAYGMVDHGIIEKRNLNMLMGICFGLMAMDPYLAARDIQGASHVGSKSSVQSRINKYRSSKAGWTHT